jgi:predicted permease
LTLGLTMTGPRYANGPAVLAAYREVWQRLEQLPGVSAAGGVSALPLSEMYSWGPITIEGRVPQPGELFLNADDRIVGGHYFEAMRIPLRSGRFFNEQDTAANPRVAVIDEFMAHEFWPNQDPVGKRIHTGGIHDANRPWITIVGVAGRVKQYALDTDSRIAIYFPQTQAPLREMNLVMRSAAEPGALANAVRSQIHALDSDLPLYQVRTMEQRVEESLARRRFSLVLLGLFAALALGLAAIGVYGVMAFVVNQATREIGIRIALGATNGGIVVLVLRRAMTLALSGIVAGLAAAIPLARLLRSMLFEVRESDALTFAAASIALAGIALLASYLPARRASRIDPLLSLQPE